MWLLLDVCVIWSFESHWVTHVLPQLSQGVLVTVPPSLVMRRKNHFHDLPCGGTVILGNNGYIWICPTAGGEDGGSAGGGTGGYVQNLEVRTAPRARTDRDCSSALTVTGRAHHSVGWYSRSTGDRPTAR